MSEQILATAQQHFLTLGYHDTSFEGIAAAVGVHKGALYARYADKFALFTEVCAVLVKHLYETDIVTLTDDLPMRDSLRAQARALIAVATNPASIAMYEMIVRDVPRHPELAKSTARVWQYYIEQISSYFQSRVDRQLLNLRDPAKAAAFFAALVLNPVHVWVVHGIDLPTKADLALHAEQAILMFLGGIGRLELEGALPAV